MKKSLQEKLEEAKNLSMRNPDVIYYVVDKKHGRFRSTGCNSSRPEEIFGVEEILKKWKEQHLTTWECLAPL